MKFDQDLCLNLRYDFGKMNSTLGSVVPLAMFSLPPSHTVVNWSFDNNRFAEHFCNFKVGREEMSTNKGEEFFFLLYIYIDRAADACIIQSKLCIGRNNFCLWRLKSLQKDKKGSKKKYFKSHTRK